MATKTDTRQGRFYEIDGEKYPSVTTILTAIGKPALVNWAANVERDLVLKVSGEVYADSPAVKMSTEAWITTVTNRLGKEKAHRKELEKAADIGSQVHRLVEWSLKAELMQEAGPSPKVSDKAQWAYMAWQDWRRSVNLKPIFVEVQVWSKEHRYAGTMDLLAEVNGVVTVLDWKSGKAIYPEAFLQNAAYRHAIREMNHADPLEGMIVRLPKVETDPEFEVAKITDSEDSLFATFLSTKEVWSWMQREEQRRNEKRAVTMALDRRD